MTRLECNFGSLKTGKTMPALAPSAPFRIALIGDFSGRSNRGELRPVDPVRCTPIRLDVDNLESVIRSFNSVLRLPLGPDQACVELHPASLDDLHPDALYENLRMPHGIPPDSPRTTQIASSEFVEDAAAVGLTDESEPPYVLSSAPDEPQTDGAGAETAALLADLAVPEDQPDASEGAMDPELAALLEDL